MMFHFPLYRHAVKKKNIIIIHILIGPFRVNSKFWYRVELDKEAGAVLVLAR